MRSESFSSTPAGSPASTAFRLYATRAIAALLVFAAWTLVVRVGISQGSRHTVWTTRAFGNWPTVIEALDGSNNMELSIRATFESGETLGSRTTGTQADFGDPANINGSRFVTGSDARRVQSTFGAAAMRQCAVEAEQNGLARLDIAQAFETENVERD